MTLEFIEGRIRNSIELLGYEKEYGNDSKHKQELRTNINNWNLVKDELLQLKIKVDYILDNPFKELPDLNWAE